MLKPVARKMYFAPNDDEKSALIEWLNKDGWTADESISIVYGKRPHVSLDQMKLLRAFFPYGLNVKYFYNISSKGQQEFDAVYAKLKTKIVGADRKPIDWLEYIFVELKLYPPWAECIRLDPMMLNSLNESIQKFFANFFRLSLIHI